jgi:hypothetical protein
MIIGKNLKTSRTNNIFQTKLPSKHFKALVVPPRNTNYNEL